MAGADVFESERLNSDFYNQLIEVLDNDEVATLKAEFAKTPFPWLCAGTDFKDHIGVVRFYYYNMDLKLTSRAVLVAKLKKVNRTTVMGVLKKAATLVGKSIADFGSWVCHGAAENGVRHSQAL